jgi:putative hemolysin
MKNFKSLSAALAGIVILVATATAQSPTVASPTPAEAYCTQQGGAVVIRVPFFGTNGGIPLRLAGPREFCQFTAHDGSTIHLLLSTLYSTEPTLAALAYYAAPALDGTGCVGNPGSCYCSQLGGTDLFGGKNLAGGGWVTDNPSNPIPTLEACIFPDLSSIDSWGLTYNSAGIVRGKNLRKVFRYQGPPGTVSAVFGKK